MTGSKTVTVPGSRTQPGIGSRDSLSNHRPALRALFYSSVLTGGLLLVNGMTVAPAYAAACNGGAVANGPNLTACSGGTSTVTLTYPASNLQYVVPPGGDFELILQNHDVAPAAAGDGITFTGVTGGNGTITLNGDSDVANAAAGNGITATATDSHTIINVNDSSSVTGSSRGIEAQSSGAGIGGDITVRTQLETAVTGNFDGISATAIDAGNINVSALGAVTGGATGDGIEAIAFGNGTVDVTTGAKEIKGGDDGIQVRSDDSTVKVTTGAGKVTGENGNGIFAEAASTVTVDVKGDVQGGVFGIVAFSGGLVDIDTTANSIVDGDGGAGIFASAFGNVDVDALGTVTGATIGIDADANTGTADVTTGAKDVTGEGGHGIEATGNIVIVNAKGNVTGNGGGLADDGIGIHAVADAGTASVTTAAGFTVEGKDGDGITAAATAGATVIANSTVTGIGAGHDGIEADGGTGGTDVTTFAGAITGDEDGIDVNAAAGTVKATTGAGDVTGKGGDGITANVANGTVTIITGDGDVTGNSGEGIQANAANGTVNVTTAAGAISGSVDGIDANVATGDVIVITGAGQVTGNSGNGIDANSANGTVKVTTGTAATAAVGFTGTGIDATASSHVTVKANGGATGTGGSGINAQSFGGGNVEVETEGGAVAGAQVRGTGLATSDGITASASGAGTITITNAAITIGAETGIDATSAGGAILITNNFSIGNESGNDAHLAIRTTGGATTIINNNTIRGRVETGALGDTLNNTNVWETEGTSNFGAGADTVTNSGIIDPANTSGVAETTTFLGLENLNNSLAIDLQDQPSGDGINLSDTLSTSGNYAGLGGNAQLGVDAFLGGPGSVSDQLIVGGSVSGTTTIFVNDTNAGPGGFDPNGILVVNVNDAGAADATNFVLNGGPIDKGFFVYDLLFDDANNNYLLVGLPDNEVFETLAAVASAQEIFRETADAWSTRQENLRDLLATSYGVTAVADPVVEGSTAPMASLWVSALGSWSDRDDDASFSLLNANLEFDLSYSQDIYGVVGGADFRTEVGTDSSLLFGVMAGYVDSKLDFDDSNTSIDTDGATVGVYAALLSNGFFATVLVKADLLNMDFSTDNVDGEDSADVTSWGARGDFGYRFGGTYFVEPMISVDGISTDIDEFTIAGADIDAGTNESFRAGAGLRAGYGDEQVRASATARVWDVFSTDNEVDILAGVPLGISDDDLEGVYGDVSAQVDLSLSTNATIYLKGGVLFSEDVTKPNASGGFALYW